jgi:hypothetical protein
MATYSPACFIDGHTHCTCCCCPFGCLQPSGNKLTPCPPISAHFWSSCQSCAHPNTERLQHATHQTPSKLGWCPLGKNGTHQTRSKLRWCPLGKIQPSLQKVAKQRMHYTYKSSHCPLPPDNSILHQHQVHCTACWQKQRYTLKESAQDSVIQCLMSAPAIFYAGYGLPFKDPNTGSQPYNYYTIYSQVALNMVNCQ